MVAGRLRELQLASVEMCLWDEFSMGCAEGAVLH